MKRTALMLYRRNCVDLVAAVSIAELVRVQSRTACTTERTNRRALLATNQTTDYRAAAGAHGYRELVTMFLPEATTLRP